MAFRQILYNGKYSLKDYGLRIISQSFSGAVKKRVYLSIPYSDGDVDISYLDGVCAYESRTLTYVFMIKADTRSELEQKISDALGWLCQPSEQEIYDSELETYHYVGHCISAEPVIEEGFNAAEITAEFVCSPYKETLNYLNPDWNSFDFFTGYLNDKLYYAPAAAAKSVTYDVYNPLNYDVKPIVRYRAYSTLSENTFNVSINGGEEIKIWRSSPRPIIIDDFILKPGKNELVISGYGCISLEYKERVL